MMKSILRNAALGFTFALGTHLGAQAVPDIVILDEPGFPVIDTAPAPMGLLHRALPGARSSSAAELDRNLGAKSTRLLVLPYGSAFPLDQWNSIQKFLSRGGNLLTLGGRPFTRPARFEDGAWRVQPETYAFARELLINDYQETPGSAHLAPVANADEVIGDVSALKWRRAYSMVIRLSQQETSARIGASGTVDSQLKTLLWGASDGKRVAAPVVQVDHFENQYSGGRWVMLNCQIEKAFLESERAGALIEGLARQALAGAELLRVTPTYPLFLPTEAWQFEFEWNRFQIPAETSTISIAVSYEGRQEIAQTFPVTMRSFPALQIVTLATSGRRGFHNVEVAMRCGETRCGTYRTAFWVQDEAYLESGPKVTVDDHYFRVDGQRIEVIGTTYMASDAQRLYFRYPNPAVWDEDMRQIADNGINMLRSGLWTDWDEVTGSTGVMTERARRTMEAFLMTARRHRLPVQFNLFAFMPEVFGGVNPYLDPEAVRREQAFVESVVQPFARVPYLMWDLINEPSFDNPKRFFGTHPNNDALEAGQWNQWLLRRHGSRDAIESAWRASFHGGTVPTPDDQDMNAASANDGGHPLSVFDFNLFAQESFADWAQSMRRAIRGAGSQQLITVGQDEGGALGSPSPAFFGKAVDFSTMHSWWFNDDLLWDSLAVRQAGIPLLVQETGVMTEVGPDGRPRRTPQADAALIEKKLGIAVGTGAGAIEWLWNINAVMRSQQEVSIGAVRPDGTEKPEAQVLEAYAKFARKIESHLSEPRSEDVAILTSQAEQYSVLASQAADAQHRAVRAMNYQCHVAARIITENHVDDIKGSKLIVLPSAQILRDATWAALMAYVREGGNLLLTGPVDRDENWQPRNRLGQLGVSARTATLDYRTTTIEMGAESVDASYSAPAQRALETLEIEGGRSYLEVKPGKGTIFLVASPVELAESPQATAAVYRHVLTAIGIEPGFEVHDLPSGILVRPQVFKDAVLYLLVSESSADQAIDIRDKLSGAKLKLNVPASRTKLVLLDRGTGAVLAQYDGPEWPME
jgi:hypothetical protein